MTDRNRIRLELREALEIKVALLKNFENVIHRRAIEKIENLLKEYEYLNISTLEKALLTIRKIYKDNFKHGAFTK